MFIFFLHAISVSRHLLAAFEKWGIRKWAGRTYGHSRALWRFRFFLRSHFWLRRTEASQWESLKNLDVTFINLDSRPDRAAAIQEEFSRLRLPPPRRFGAVSSDNAMLGAATSHYEAIKQASLRAGARPIMVCEDDLQFLCDRETLEEIYSEFMGNPLVDVLCLAFIIKNTTRMTAGEPVEVGPNLLISNEIITQACYVLKPRAIATVLASLDGSRILLGRGLPWRYAAGDVLWQRVQQGKLFFAVPKVRTSRQREGFSDIWQSYKSLKNGGESST